MSGFSVGPDSLRGHATAYDARRANADRAREALRAAFDRGRNTLGDDDLLDGRRPAPLSQGGQGVRDRAVAQTLTPATRSRRSEWYWG
ncbi:hypothetical protein ABZ897_06920 [Nonomuraea sp. NPDC046802]|uniref:hypothetical protein n=1 Tax=Nonomuraea sp. NPDC046802 TaxID=3154919 RepID=UPI0034069F2C